MKDKLTDCAVTQPPPAFSGKTFAYLILLMIACCLGRPTFAQETPRLQQVLINLAARNKPLDKILQDIESQTQFRFVYNPAELKAAGTVSVNRRMISVDEALEELLPASLEFRQRGLNILILVKEEPVQANPNAPFLVTGRIIDVNQQPLPGVTVTVKSSNRATVTNEQGNFMINATRNDSLELSSVGFANRVIAVQPRPMTILLNPNQRQALNEVIVIGYGNLQRKKLSTAISTVSAAQLNERSASINIVEAMAGKVPGASIMLNSGKPGSSPTIKIRGTGSINASNAPLFVLDGIVGLDPMLIDPNIIQSVDILKDAASAAIYGSRGSNGVILMTTKEGVKNRSNIIFTNRISVGTLAREIDLLDAQGALDMIERQYAYVPGRLAPHKDPNNNFSRKAELFNADGTPRYNVNWQKEATRPAFSTNTGLTFTGGRDNLTSLVSVSYKKQEGIFENSYLQQINLFANIGWDVKPWFHLKTIINGGGLQSRNVDLNALGFNAIREMYEYLPFIPARYSDGTWSRKGDYPGAEQSENPNRLLNDVKSVTGQTYVMGNMTGTIHLGKKVDLVTSFSGQLGGNYNNYYSGIGVFGFSDVQHGVAQRMNGNAGAWTNEDYLTFNDRFGKHKLNAVVGASWYYNVGTGTFAGSENFFDDLFGYNSLQAGTLPQGPVSNRQQNQMNSFYTRLQYDYDSRYLAGASFRVDGSSRFGANNKYGYFPAVWAAWLLSGEKFFAPLLNTVNYFKLRVSWGVTGNSEIGNYATLSRLNPTQVVFNGQQQPAVVLSNPGNKDLKWERGKQWNIGVDASILNDRIQITAEAYRKLTSDLLYNKQLPSTTGFTGIYDNIGSIRNQGIELSIRSRNITGNKFSWTTGFNFYLNRSKVLHLNGDIIYNWAGRIKEGQPIDQYFGYYRTGTWSSKESQEAAAFGRKPGDIKWADNNNNGMKDAGDRVPLGSKMPRYQCDLTNTFSKGAFSLFVDISGMFGHKLANFPRFIMESSTTSVNSYSGILNGWTPENQQTSQAQLRLQTDRGENEMDNYYIEDGSFVRVRNMALNYELQPTLLRKLHMEKCTIGVNAENYFLFTKYKGFDPETTSFDGDLNQGVDVYQYPKAKTISFTLQVTL
ncbi:TonB-dependent receptor [Paraflavitalea sp. CAU 1676]|uniref:SusC/RagA family TonB-linked outer membrane protein n=1 Tax=Paraflavitalea sp. CAU 1676 TaxID=3032598 RepID=UPI0023DAF7B5|nr:TonB-dependent receptor [Paraflavitalea sp. CAU 1676]MDF2192311.1 TonB-dependent receptor [Paraflavitalea sp. CAU 1676]